MHRMFHGLGGAPAEPPAAEERIQDAEIAASDMDYDLPGADEVIETVIRTIMEVTGYEREEIEPDMNLREDLAIRSSRLPVILDGLEGRFEIKIGLEDFRDVRTIRDLSEKILEVKTRGKSGRTGGRKIKTRRRSKRLPSLGRSGRSRP